MNRGREDYGKKMMEWMHELFPICRSITGKGLRETIFFIKDIFPELFLIEFKSGDKVFDWIIPQEWNIYNAYFEHESGKKFAEFTKHNLHVLNYSIPVNKWVDKDELLEHVHTQPDQPDWIPYVTSYYKERWGFCMSENDKNKLPQGNYKVYVDSSIKNGKLNLAELVIPGKNTNEVFFSTYICHPSMANNELSGPVLQMALIKYIKNNYKNPRYTYRFIFLPETIGSIAYLSKFYQNMKNSVIAGFNISCVGDNRAFSYIASINGDTLADSAVKAALIGKSNVKYFSFLDRGSDERQYCSPGIDLPVCGFCRSKYGEYPEYHTSADNFDVVTKEGLEGSFSTMTDIIDSFEIGLFLQSANLCEPQLGRRSLYPTLSQKGENLKLKLRMDIIAYSDGNRSVFEIAKIIEQPLDLVNKEIKLLIENNLLKVFTK